MTNTSIEEKAQALEAEFKLARAALLKLAAVTQECPGCALSAGQEDQAPGCLQCRGTGQWPVFPELRDNCFVGKQINVVCSGAPDRKGPDRRCPVCGRWVKGRHMNLKNSTWSHAACCDNRLWSPVKWEVAAEKLMLRAEFRCVDAMASVDFQRLEKREPQTGTAYLGSTHLQSQQHQAIAIHPFNAVIFAFCAAYGIKPSDVIEA